MGNMMLSSLNRESSANSNDLPTGVKKIIDGALYELYSPGKGTPVEIDIIFFHGLQLSDYRDAYWKTWSRDGNTIWPRTLLGAMFPRARILAVSYDSSARVSKTREVPTMYQIGENLVKEVIENNRANVGRDDRLVMLVGHSFGGFAMKQFIMHAHAKRCPPDFEGHRPQITLINNFLNNLCGIFYYATPHGGSRLADTADRYLPGNSDVLRFLRTLGKEAARLNEDFREWREANKIPAYTVAESHTTKFLKVWFTVYGFTNFIVVEEASARVDTDEFYTAREDHFNVCKPQEITSATYQVLEDFIAKCVEKKGKQLTRSQESLECEQQQTELDLR